MVDVTHRVTISYLLHSFLFAVYPVIALLAYNVEETPLAAGIRPLVVSLLGTGALLVFAWVLIRDWMRASFVVTCILVLFFSYGHVYDLLEPVRILGLAVGRHRLLMPVWMVLLAGGLWWVIRKAKDLRQLARALNIIAVVALVFPLVQLGLCGARRFEASPVGQSTNSEMEALHWSGSGPAPDIYYIILDGYARDDILQKFYQLDNRPFLDQLAGLGFYVARCSQSNYAQTQLSLASSLNLNYLNAFGDRYISGNTSRVGLSDLIKHSATRRALESLGYSVIAFETGFEVTQLEDADVYLSPRIIQPVNDFENLLIRTTAARILMEGVAFLHLPPDWEARDQAHREQVLFALDKLPTLPGLPGPKFVFAHIVAPHWPHVFGPNGEKVHEHPDSISGYRDQVIFLNKKIIPILQEIIKNSPVPPVIILQGDHGAVIESPVQRMSIFNAYYLPGTGKDLLYERVSPVNTFRVILNSFFGGNFPILEDWSYYSRYKTPYEFQFVPEERPGCQ